MNSQGSREGDLDRLLTGLEQLLPPNIRTPRTAGIVAPIILPGLGHRP